MDSRKRKTVFAIVDRDGRSWWRPLGVGFVNADGSIDMTLDALPHNGALQLRDAVRRQAHVQESGT